MAGPLDQVVEQARLLSRRTSNLIQQLGELLPLFLGGGPPQTSES